MFSQNLVCREIVAWYWDTFLVLDREPLPSILSEPATNSNLEEQLLWKLSEQKGVGKVPL